MLKAGGDAAAELVKKEEETKQLENDIKEYREQNGKDANEFLQGKLNELKVDYAQVEALKLKKKENEEIKRALEDLPKRKAEFISEQSLRVVKAYADSLRALGPAYAGAAQEAEDLAARQAEYDKLIKNHTPVEAAKAAIVEMGKAQRETNAATAAYTAGDKASRALVEYGQRMDDAAKKSKALLDADNEVDRARAKNSDALEKQERDLQDESDAIERGKAARTLYGEALDNANKQLAANTALLEENKKKRDAGSDADVAAVIKKATDAQKEQIATAERYRELLKTEPEWEAKSTSEIEKKAQRYLWRDRRCKSCERRVDCEAEGRS